MIQWYYAAKDGVRKGPVSIEELRALYASGGLLPSDLVWNQEMKDWKPVLYVPEFASNPYAAPDSPWIPEARDPASLGWTEITPGSDPIGIGTCIGRGFDLTAKNALPLILGMLIIGAIMIGITLPLNFAQGLTREQSIPRELMGDPNPFALFKWSIQQQISPLNLLQQVISLVASSFLFAGFYRICLNVFAGAPASPGQVFGEGRKLPRILAVTVITTFPSWIGYFAIAYLDMMTALVIYGLTLLLVLVLWVRLGYAAFAVVDRDLGVAESLKYSLSITRRNSLRIVGLAIPTFLIAMLGFLVCGFGALFTVPVALMIFTTSYRWLQYGRRALELAPVR